MKKATDPTKVLKRELADLKKKVAKLEKQLARIEKRTAVTCSSLEVVDSKGNSILKLGEIDGSPFVSLRARGDKESVSISAKKGQGAILMLSDKDGDGCLIATATKNGTLVRLSDSLLGSPGVEIRAHHGSANLVGEIFTYDRDNNVTARMPPKT